MNRGSGRRNVFETDRDRQRFLQCLDDAADATGTRIESYCLMGNHYHLGLHCPQGGLSRMMQHVGGNYTRWYNSSRGLDGPIFRSRFHSMPIDSERYLVACTRYIHLNPLDLGRDPRTYRWSSCGAYLGRALAPQWLTPEVPLRLSGGTARYEELLRDEAMCGPSASYGEYWTPVDGHHLWEQSQAPSADQLTHIVGRDRTVMLLVFAELYQLGADSGAAKLGYSSAASYRSALARAKSKSQHDPETKQALQRARRQLGLESRVLTKGV